MEVQNLLHEVEVSHTRMLATLADRPDNVSTLKDSVVFLLDVLCQVEDLDAQREVMTVLERVFLSCLPFFYDRAAFTDAIKSNLTSRSTNANDGNVTNPSITGKTGNVVLNALLHTVTMLTSKSGNSMEIARGVVGLVQELCSQSMSSEDVVMLFDFLRLNHPPARRLVLQLQKNLIEMEAIPRAIFTMNGQHGGIIAPSDEVLFSKKGYTCSFGVWLESNAPLVSLCSFRGNNGHGVSIVLEGSTLIVKSHASQGNSYHVAIPFAEWRQKMEREWVHLCIVHAKKMLFKDKITVFVDGKSIYNGSLVYPDPLCMVGGHNCIGTAPSLPGFQGKMWSPTLFGQALSEAEVQKLHWLTHWKNDLTSVAAENSSLSDKSKFIFSFDARSCDMERRICYDVSGNDCNGWLEPGTRAYITKGFVQALDTIGGCACFLLLLLDQIPEMADFHPKHEFLMDEISSLLAFVSTGIQNSMTCRSHFIRLNGIRVLAFVLQSVSPSYLSVHMLNGVISVLEAILSHMEKDVVVECIHLLLFFNTSWFLAPYETQLKLLSEVLPNYLMILQETKARDGSALGVISNGLNGNVTASSAASIVDATALLEVKREVDVRYFCNLLVQVYSPRDASDTETTTSSQMDSKQLEQLRHLVIHRLIDRLLFPFVPDPSIDQWRQLVAHIYQRCSGATSNRAYDADNERADIVELLRYLNHVLASDTVSANTQTLHGRQLLGLKIRQLSNNSLRIWWKPLLSTIDCVRLEALKLLELYMLDKMPLRKEDILMLYSTQQAHVMTSDTAKILMDIVLGRNHIACNGNSFSSATSASSGRAFTIAKLECIPLILLGLIHNANFKIQCQVLHEVKTLLSSGVVGDSVKESIRSWPPWLSRLRSIYLSTSQLSNTCDPDCNETTQYMDEHTLNYACMVLSDERTPVIAKQDAIQKISEAKDIRGCDFVVGLFHDGALPSALTKAIVNMVNEHFPERCCVLVGKMANYITIDIIVYSIMQVRNGWMHLLELYFYEHRNPANMCSLMVSICEKVLQRIHYQSPSSFDDTEYIWENLCQVAAIVSQCHFVATQLSSRLNIEDALLSSGQQIILCRKAFEMWLVVLPRLQFINWNDSIAHLIQNANYGSDITPEEKEIFCNIVADSSRSRLLALQVAIQRIAIAQDANENRRELMQSFRNILQLLHLITSSTGSSLPVQSGVDSTCAGSLLVTSPRMVNVSIPTASGMTGPESSSQQSISEGQNFVGSAITASHELLEVELARLYVLDACYDLLQSDLSTNTDFRTPFLIVEVMVALSNSAVQVEAVQIQADIKKTLEIISSTDLGFFHEVSQLQELANLWELYRERHQRFCDVVTFQRCVDTLNTPFANRWVHLMEHHAVDFNPYLIQKHACAQAELLGEELRACEELWKEIEDNVATTALSIDTDEGDENYNSALKEDVEKFASSVHKLVAKSTQSADIRMHENADINGFLNYEDSNVNGGFLFKVGSKENCFRMRLRLKRVRENYRIRNLSYEYAASTFHDSDSRCSGNLAARRFRTSGEGYGINGDLEQSWRSDAGSDYSDFLADAQMRAAIIRSYSNLGIDDDGPYNDLSDEEDVDDEGVCDYDAQQESNLAWEQIGGRILESDNSTQSRRSIQIALPDNNLVQETEELSSSAVTSESPVPSVSSISSGPSSPLLSYSSTLGASVLSVVGGVAGMVQKAAKDAKDAMDFSVDTLYTARDALSEDALSLIEEVTTSIDNSLQGTELSSMPSSSSSTNTNMEGMTTHLSMLKNDEKDRRSVPTVSASSEVDRSSSSKGKGFLRDESTRSITRPNSSNSKRTVSINAKLIRHLHVVEGKLIVSDTMLFFIAERVIDEHDATLVEKKKGVPLDKAWRFLFRRRRWKVDDIASLHRRRYLLKPTALEIFIHSTRKTYFFNLSMEDVIVFHEALMARRPLLLKRDPAMRRLRHPSSIFRNSPMSVRWIHHEISTFEYLMWLNTIAGRTYNDLTQYPVFPWVIADYESPKLDLSRRSVYRDLSKPVGALDPNRLKFFLDRYNAFEDPDIPKFMYGTHYSNIGAVLYYLIRLEPFTSYALSIQGGKFDHADRLFHSVAETWKNCLTDFTDVKELTPEWFYLPEFLVNCNNLDLGTKQNGVSLGNVILPSWAQSPEDFIMKNLVALESEYVSENLHHWIDLVFGANQRGPAAVAANNVFFYLTYEGMVDIDSIADPVMKSSMRAQIAHFGQTPSQVLRDPHPQRQIRYYNLKFNNASLEIAGTLLYVPHEHPIVFVDMVPGTSLLVCVDSKGMLSFHRYGGKSSKVHHSPLLLSDLPTSATKASGVFKVSTTTVSSGGGGTSPSSVHTGGAEQHGDYIELQDRKCRRVLAEKRFMSTEERCLSNWIAFINGSAVFCTVGHHDFSARFYSSSDGTLLYRLLQHNSVLTCLNASQKGTMLALGCADGTLSIWKLANVNSTLLNSIKIFRGSKSNSKPVHANDYDADQVLLGHNSAINCVSISEELGLCISGSASNECLAHNLDDGSIHHQYHVSGNMAPGITALALSNAGHVLVHSLGTGSSMLYSFHLNGTAMANISLGERPMISLSVCARYSKVVVSNKERALLLSAHTLEDQDVILEKEMYGEIVSQALSPDETHIVFGVGSGKIVCMPLLASYSNQHRTEM